MKTADKHYKLKIIEDFKTIKKWSDEHGLLEIAKQVPSYSQEETSDALICLDRTKVPESPPEGEVQASEPVIRDYRMN